MAQLPNNQRAVVDLRKLTEYSLNEASETGSHKARLFRAALGLTAADADWLAERLLEAARTMEAKEHRHDEFGQRYEVDLQVTFRGRQALVRSGWIVRSDEDFPRLTTCYVLKPRS